MATDVVLSSSSLQAELDKARSGLYDVEENLKKAQQSCGRYRDSYKVNKQGGGGGGPHSFANANAKRYNENNSFTSNSKRNPGETKTVFSRLSRKVEGDSDAEDDPDGVNKSRISSQVTRTLPTKQEILRAQLNTSSENKKDTAEVCRARRVFGSLLGTLRAFCKEDALARDKEVFARRVSIEKKIDRKATVEAAQLLKQRRALIQQKEQQIQRIKVIERQMHRIQGHEVWEKAQKQLTGFIKTSTKPAIYWKPARTTEKTKHLISSSQHQLKKTLEKKRIELEADLEAINISSKRLAPRRQLKDNSSAIEETTNHEDMDSCEIANEDIKMEMEEVKVKTEKTDDKKSPTDLDVEDKTKEEASKEPTQSNGTE